MFHQPVRTRLAVLLAARARSFSHLKSELDVTDGNLDAHLRKLSGAGDLHSRMVVEGRPHTLYELSPSGRQAFMAYVTSMSALLERAAGKGDQLELLEFVDAGLAIKLASTALLVVVATGFAARFGAFIGAMIAAIPISAGPSYLFIAMENDAAFVAQSALASVAINPLTVVFLLISATLIERFGIVIALTAGMAAWFAAAFAVTRVALTLEQACLLNVVIFVVAIYLSRPLLGDALGKPAKRGWLDIPLRVVAVVTVVGSAVIVGRLVGPQAAGVVALVPVVWISMAVVIYTRQGGATCSAVLANGIVPMIGFWLGLAAIHLLAESHGSTIALLAGLAVPVSFTLGLTVARPYIPMYNVTRADAK